MTHRDRVANLLEAAAEAHRRLLAELPPAIGASLPVDAQGLTRAIDHLAEAIGMSLADRRDLVRPHGLNPAVLHARVFGASRLDSETIVGAFTEGARVRAAALTVLADAIGGAELTTEVRALLVEHPPPAGADGPDVLDTLRSTYGAQEQAVLRLAGRLDGD